jgi:hypothetical protein
LLLPSIYDLKPELAMLLFGSNYWCNYCCTLESDQKLQQRITPNILYIFFAVYWEGELCFKVQNGIIEKDAFCTFPAFVGGLSYIE